MSLEFEADVIVVIIIYQRKPERHVLAARSTHYIGVLLKRYSAILQRFEDNQSQGPP